MLCCWKILLQRDCWWEKSDDNEEKQEVSSTEVEAETPVIVTVTDHTIDRVASSIDPDGTTDEEDVSSLNNPQEYVIQTYRGCM